MTDALRKEVMINPGVQWKEMAMVMAHTYQENGDIVQALANQV